MIATTLLFCLLQDPTPRAAPTRTDVIRLDSGSELEGKITKETDDYVEIELGTGMVVGFEKSRATAILRGAAGDFGPMPAAGSAAEVASAPAGETVRAHDQWFALHDASGHAIGWLHEHVAAADDGGVRISEEWRFTKEDRTTELTVLETLDAQRQPRTCFYHERVRDADTRVVAERVVHGVVAGGQLAVDSKSLQGGTTHSYAFADGARFPLELRAALRRGDERGRQAFDVFDPRLEEWTRDEFDIGGMRSIEQDGGRVNVRVLREETRHGPNLEWLDGAGSCVRREIAGPALVAVPMSETKARDLATRNEPCFDAALLAEAGKRFGLWLPNPMWSAGAVRTGEVTARAEAFDASMSLVLLDQLGQDVLIDSAADSVERWMRLGHPDVKFEARARVRMRGGEAVRMKGAYEVRQPGAVTVRCCDVVVFARQEAGFLAFCADAPKAALAELATDFERALTTVELLPQSIEPLARGPVDVK